jgi:hypothetical protein
VGRPQFAEFDRAPTVRAASLKEINLACGRSIVAAFRDAVDLRLKQQEARSTAARAEGVRFPARPSDAR